jgi:hypothetical protein
MNDILQRDHRTVRGTIRYTSKKPDRMDQERGREYFTINVHSDGKRTCIAHCEIDDRPSVMRDITYSLDEDWYPMDCFVRIAVNDRFMGSGWFRFGPDYAECETYTHMRLFDRSKAGQGVQSIDEMLLSSPDHRGATGPMLFRIGFGVEYVGEENIDVEAGNFDALHFRFVSSPGLPEAHPPYDIWCTNDGDFMFLRGDIGGYMQTFYELVELIQD